MNRDALQRELLDWFDSFADCVRRRDLASAQALFDSRVIAFGTRNELMEGLESLRERQWRPTWNATRDFHFLPDTIHVEIGAGGDRAWGISLWRSLGDPADGPRFERRGRATFVFARDGHWRCTHSHLSLTPTGEL